MNEAAARQFVARYASGDTTPEEKAAFTQWLYAQPEADVERLLALYEDMLSAMPPAETDPQWTARLNARIDRMEAVPVRRMYPYRKWAIAAAVLLLMATGAWFWGTRTTPRPSTHAATNIPKVLPGTGKAILTLSDGSEVALDSTGNRSLQQGNTAIRQQGGELVYAADGSSRSVGYNTLRTPRKGEFSLTLPDGTRVWLNAESSLRYPTAFDGTERLVDITGEAYFEVAKNAAKPFRVRVANNTRIDVLGTSFNVNSYTNEKQMNITLLNGSVRVHKLSGGATALLKPGQQAQITQQIRVINAVDTDKAVAWKNGAFNFDNVGIGEAMRQLERWYDIEVVYENGVPDIYFGGELSRQLSLNDILIALEKSNVHFRIDGNKLIVTK